MAFKLWSCLNYTVQNIPMHTYQLESQTNVVTTALQYTLLLAHLLNWAHHPTSTATLELVLHMQALHSVTQTFTD